MDMKMMTATTAVVVVVVVVVGVVVGVVGVVVPLLLLSPLMLALMTKAHARGCWKQNTSSSEWHVVRKSLSNTIAACTLRSHIVLQYVNRLGIYHDAVHGKWSGVSRNKVYCSSSGTAAFKRVVNSFCLALRSSLYLVWKAFLNYFAPNQHQSYY